MIAYSRRHPQLTFLTAAILINIAASFAGRMNPRAALAAVFDMTVTVSAVYYWLIVRPGLRPKVSLLFVGLLGLLRASFAFPRIVPGREFILGAIELLVVIAIFTGSRIVPFQTVERLVRAEFSGLYYAFAWRAKPDVPVHARAFTLHKDSGIADLLIVLAPFSLIEVVLVHLLASRWNHTAAWILTGLGLYSGIWMFALGRSFALRPGYETDDEIVVRFGLLFSLRIPKDCIESIQREPVENAATVRRNSVPNLYIAFTRPLEAERMLGFTKQVSAIAIQPDGQFWPGNPPDSDPVPRETPRP
ncbi:MAG: hypothetical protein KGN84_00590 [Acidobacteriota bacterium]|nr:hypothetical protein [Acidobacteriota bacterium]